MADDSLKKAAFVTRLQQQVCAFLDQYNGLVGLTTEAASMGYGADGGSAIGDDQTGQPQIDAARLNAVLGTLHTLNAALIDPTAGHLTNLQRLRP